MKPNYIGYLINNSTGEILPFEVIELHRSMTFQNDTIICLRINDLEAQNLLMDIYSLGKDFNLIVFSTDIDRALIQAGVGHGKILVTSIRMVPEYAEVTITSSEKSELVFGWDNYYKGLYESKVKETPKESFMDKHNKNLETN